jgi:hypothetical protein
MLKKGKNKPRKIFSRLVLRKPKTTCTFALPIGNNGSENEARAKEKGEKSWSETHFWPRLKAISNPFFE